MTYDKKAKNDFNFCSAFKANELLLPGDIICNSTNGNRSYTLTAAKKKKIISGLAAKKISLDSINWIGERRTKLLSGNLLQFGYGSFVKED